MDNLKLKLTLKKQTWTGGSSSTDNETDKLNQPLAWGISVINRRKTIKPDPNEELLAYDHDHSNQIKFISFYRKQTFALFISAVNAVKNC